MSHEHALIAREIASELADTDCHAWKQPVRPSLSAAINLHEVKVRGPNLAFAQTKRPSGACAALLSRTAHTSKLAARQITALIATRRGERHLGPHMPEFHHPVRAE